VHDVVRSKFLDELRGELRQVRARGTFARNAAYAFGGTAMVVASQILITPFVARIYGPEVFGIYGIFLNLCMNLALVADLGYTNAYMLPREQDRVLDLARGNLLILGVVIVLMLPICLVRDAVYRWLPSWSAMGGWFYLLPLGVATQFVPVILTAMLLRAKAFGRSSGIGGGTNLVLRLFNLFYGWFSRGAAHGLMLGEVLVRGASIAAYVRALRPHGIGDLLGGFDLRRILAALREYRSYPLYIFPERWIALLGVQLPVFLLSHDPVAVGLFGMAASLLLIPLRLFGFSLGAVFQQKAADIHREDPTGLAPITGRFFDRLMVLAVLPFAAVAVFGDHLFALVLGEPWRGSGVYAAWLAMFFYYRMLSEPIMGLMNVHRREPHLLLFQSLLLLARLGAIALGLYVLRSTDLAIAGYGAVSALAYIVLSAGLLRTSGAAWKRRMLLSLLAMAIALALFMLMRWAIFGTAWPAR